MNNWTLLHSIGCWLRGFQQAYAKYIAFRGLKLQLIFNPSPCWCALQTCICVLETLPGVSSTTHLSSPACWDQECQQEESNRLVPSVCMSVNNELGAGPDPIWELCGSRTLGTQQSALDTQAGSHHLLLQNPCPKWHTSKGKLAKTAEKAVLPSPTEMRMKK